MITKKLLLIFFLAIIISCSSQVKNPTGLNPEKMTEEELYMHYGLEAPPELYQIIYNSIKDKPEFSEICKERTVSQFVAVEIKNNKFNKLGFRFSDYPATLESLISNAIINKSTEDNLKKYGVKEKDFVDFRLDIKKLCEGNDFSPTPPKDNTLETMPRLNEALEPFKDFKIK
jgi:hypothetical protein